MSTAWTPEWFTKQMDLCRADDTFQQEAATMNASYVCKMLPDPDHGVDEEFWWGFRTPAMSEAFCKPDPIPDTEFVIEGPYSAWYEANEGIKTLVDHILDGNVKVSKGETSFLAMYVPVIVRFFELSKTHTTAYHGNFGGT